MVVEIWLNERIIRRKTLLSLMWSHPWNRTFHSILCVLSLTATYKSWKKWWMGHPQNSLHKLDFISFTPEKGGCSLPVSGAAAEKGWLHAWTKGCLMIPKPLPLLQLMVPWASQETLPQVYVERPASSGTTHAATCAALYISDSAT